MYDNLHMRLATVEGQTSTVTNRLSNPKQTIDIDTGECRTFGYLNNLRVSVYPSGLYIVGSLAKYFNGGNIYTLNRRSTEMAVQKLSDDLGIDVSNCSMTQFILHFYSENPIFCVAFFAIISTALSSYSFNKSTTFKI